VERSPCWSNSTPRSRTCSSRHSRPPVAERGDAFFRLRRLIAVHETAEEEFVHPRARWVLPDGDPIANARVVEETASKHALLALEKLDANSEEFTDGLRQLQRDVVEHARAEEQEEFVQLEALLEDQKLRRMRHLITLAEKLAPTRPHPQLALGGENALAGGFAMMLDRARDLFSQHSATDGAES
jgi:hemerythrin superfamily protein